MSGRKGSNRPEAPRSQGPKAAALIFLAGCLLPQLAACKSGSPNGSLSSPLVIGTEAGPVLLDPRLATDAYSERVNQLLFNGLVQLDPDGRILPDLAERWTVENDRSYVFHLRKGVRFHDGSELSSADVRYTFESILSPSLASPYRKNFDVIDRIEAPDAATVRFTLKRPHAPFLQELTRGIVRRPLAEEDHPGVAPRPIGTGPFVLDSWVPDQAVELSAFPQYFEGAPKISKLVFRVIPEEGTRLLELLAGSLDILENSLSPDLLDRVREDPDLVVVTGEGNSYTYMGLNLTSPILSDLRVRRAIAHAIDREGIIKNLLRGEARVATGVLPPGHWAYEPDVRAYPYDPSAAKRILKEAHFRLPIRLSYKTSQNELARRIAEAIQHQLSEVGIEVDLRTFEWGTFYDDIKSGNFQLYTLSWVGVNDPDIYFNLFHSESVPPAGANRGRYRNPEVDRLLEKGRQTVDTEARAKIYRLVQKRIAEDLPYVSLWHTKNIVVRKRNLVGFVLYPGGDLISLKSVERVSR